MTSCEPLGVLAEAFQPEVERMRELGGAYKNGAAPGACEAFTEAATSANTTLRFAYRLTAATAAKSSRLESSIQCWELFISLADTVLAIIVELRDRFPECGTPGLYDRAMDLRNAAKARKNDAEEVNACLATEEIPAGLFPTES